MAVITLCCSISSLIKGIHSDHTHQQLAWQLTSDWVSFWCISLGGSYALQVGLLTWVGREAERSTLTAASARGLPSTGERAYGMALYAACSSTSVGVELQLEAATHEQKISIQSTAATP